MRFCGSDSRTLRVWGLDSARRPGDLERDRDSRVYGSLGRGGVDHRLPPRRTRGRARGEYDGRGCGFEALARGELAALARGRARAGRRTNVGRMSGGDWSCGCCGHRRRSRSSRPTSWRS